jgi:HemY protein
MNNPIRSVVWILGITAVAVAIALIGRYNQGFVMLVIPPWRIELSLNFAFVLLGCGFIVLYLLIRSVSALIQAPGNLRVWRAEKERADARDAIADALTALFSGRFDHAESAARRAMALDETRDIAATIAAWSTFEGGNAARAIPYLQNITGENAARMRDTSLAYVHLAEGRAAEALTILKRLHHIDARNPGVLKMKLEAELAEFAWDEVLATLPKLVQAGLLPESAAEQIRMNAILNLVKKKAASSDALLEFWKALPSGSRREPAVAGAVARGLIALGCGADAQQVAEESLEHEWDSGMARLYGDCKGASALAQIERAETWLRSHARDASLLLALGKLCMRQGLWGKAQSYLEASIVLEPSLDAHMALANLMERLGRPADAVRHIRKSAELAG